MAEASKIEWTDATYNPWIGCTRVGPGCDGCYAADLSHRYGWAEWGAGKPRKRKSEKTRDEPRKWNAAAEKAGKRLKVFCASLADVFDNEVPADWRADLWRLICETPWLDWIIVTKRIGNAKKMLPPDWGDGYPNVILLITVVNQEEADRDIPKLLKTPARRRGLSIEPILGPIDLTMIPTGGKIGNAVICDNALTGPPDMQPGERLDWIIVGGESGPKARPPMIAWVRSLRDQCADAGTPFFFKQWGEFKPDDPASNRTSMVRVGKKIAGAELDGRQHKEFPA